MNRLRHDRICNGAAEKHLEVIADHQQNPSHQCCEAEKKISMLTCTESVMCKLCTFIESRNALGWKRPLEVV